MLLSSPAACQRYISIHNASEIAQQLRCDQERCKKGALPSALALSLPKASSRLADDISLQLLDEKDRYTIKASIRHLQYESVIHGIKAHIGQLGQNTAEDSSIARTIPSTSDFSVALKVLEYLQANPEVGRLKPTSQFTDVLTAVRTQLSLPPELRSAYRSSSRSRGPRRKRRKCYMCHYLAAEPHELYPSLCKPCGTFNLAESSLSLPDSLNLDGKTALVTGGRVALGLHTTLRLLRCGAKVIVSSRYPRDTERRYHEEDDFNDWSSQLRIVGADFRTARDVFSLVTVVRRILAEWDQSLDVLINNAAQTLTDSLAMEKKAVRRELDLLEHPLTGSPLMDENPCYQARVRGGTQGLAVEITGSQPREISNGDADNESTDTMELEEVFETDSALLPTTQPSSWTQSLADVPYEDIITAHSVNTFVPFILCRELLGCMPSSSSNTGTPNGRPCAYIINVSSREGIFEASPTASVKNGHHVHTNMSKAALNMLTETESARIWRTYRIAMNTVDPGYMSAAPEYRSLGDCPIGFDDGAARVLWPVALGESKGESIWGRFLKHFGEVKVDVGKDR